MFDEGLWTFDNDYRIHVHPARFIEAGPDALRLQSYAGRLLQFLPNAMLKPLFLTSKLLRLSIHRDTRIALRESHCDPSIECY